MSGRLTAGERLVPHAKRPPATRHGGPPSGGPPDGPSGGPPPGRGPRRRRAGPLRWAARLVVFAGALLVVCGAAGGFVAWRYYEKVSANLPTLDVLRHYEPPLMTRVYADNDQLVSELATERRIYVPWSAIPPIVAQAFVSAEDHNYWVHGGIDPEAIIRAAFTDLENYGSGRRPIGASTITQQVAKNMLLNDRVTLSRKVREAILAMRIEHTLSKQRILDIYLNEIYLGQGAYGIAAAAQTYFNKPLDRLTVAEAAFLAALPKGPNNYNPYRYPDAARARRDWVLDRMAEDHAITPAQAASAKAQPLGVVPAGRADNTVQGAGWFAQEVRRRLVARFGQDLTDEGGLVVHTSLNPKLQHEAERALHDGLLAYQQRHGDWHGPVARLDDGPSLRAGWAKELAKISAPPGMLADWHLAVVLKAGPRQAELGWLAPGQTPSAAPVPRTSPMYLSDMGWARHDGVAPRRISDVLQVGDVVMAQPEAATAAHGRTPARAARLLLRQIPKVEGALVALDPDTGRVLALVGGWSPELSKFDRATQANRQPGSSFKPFVYLAALEHGYSPSQRFLDGPFVLDVSGQGQWRPSDYERTFLGDVSLRIALEKSLNLVTIRVANRIGMDEVAQTAQAFHVVDKLPHVLSASLGSVETTVMRQAGAYAGLALEGRAVTPHLIDSVQDRDGHVLWRADDLACDGCNNPARPPTLADNRQQVADPASTYQLIRMMEGVVKRGTGVAAGRGIDHVLAGKTGTTQDARDAWFVGFSPKLVTAVWVGFDDPQSLGAHEQGATVAAPIWHDFMAAALAGAPKLDFPMPPGVTLARWDSRFGEVTDAFKPGQTPGASVPLGGGQTDAAMSVSAGPGPGAAAGPPGGGQGTALDSAMGGLY